MLKFLYRFRILFFIVCCGVFYSCIKQNLSNKAAAEEIDESSERQEEIKTIGEEGKTIRYSIYDGDYSTYKSKLAKTIEVDSTLSLENKVRKVASSLSETLYNDLPIEVTVEDRSCKKIAIINLIEPLESDNKKFQEIYNKLEDKTNTWQYYFEHKDAKSIVTLASLEATFYQKDTQNDWIDGFMIYHNGETLNDHRNNTTTDIVWIKK